MQPLSVFAMGDKEFRARMQSYLIDVGLDRVFNASALPNPKEAFVIEPYVSHTSMAATRAAARLLLGQPHAPSGFFHNVTTRLASKTAAEALAGVLVNRVSLIVSNGAAKRCAARGVAWRGSDQPGLGYRQDAAPQYRGITVGYFKVHCSDWNHIVPLDVTLATLIGIADSNADGFVTRPELVRSILRWPSVSAQLHRATCLSLPIGHDSRLRRFLEVGAQAMDSVPTTKPKSHAPQEQSSSSTMSRAGVAPCMYWAQEALTLLHHLPTNQSVVMAQIERHAALLMGPFVRPLSRTERFWSGGESLQDAQANNRTGSTTEMHWHAAAREYAEAFFALADGDANGLLAFNELRAAARPGRLLPLCWRAGTWLGDAAAAQVSAHAGAGDDTHATLQQSRPASSLNANVQTSINFAGRLLALQTEFLKRRAYHSWQRSDGLAPALIASSMLYARASVCCLRWCGDRPAVPADGRRAECRQCTSFSTQL